MKGEPDWMRDFRLKSLPALPEAPDAQLGRRHVGDLLRRHLLLHQAHRRAGRRLGRAARLGQEHLREAGHPRGRAQVPRRRHRPVRVRGRLPPQPRGPRGRRASSSPTWTRRCASTPRSCEAYFGKIIPPNDNKFSALNSAVWSGGSFIYVPAGRRGRDAAAGLLPHQRREHGPVRAHADHRRRGLARCTTSRAARRRCTPPTRCTRPSSRSSSPSRPGSPTRPSRTGRTTSSTWSPSGPGSRPRATWSGSTATSARRLTMKYPAVVMVGPKASGEVLSVAYAGAGQHQDAGAKMIHAAPETTSEIVSKSISKDGGRTIYRGLVRVEDGAYGCKSHVQCDALILDEHSRLATPTPTWRSASATPSIGHEATVSKVADEQLFYLMSRGLSAGAGHGHDRQRLHRAGHPHAAHGVRGRVEPPDRAADGGLASADPGRPPVAAVDRQVRRPHGPMAAGLRRVARADAECKHFESRTYATATRCGSATSTSRPRRPWRCPADCPGYERRLADVAWAVRHGASPRRRPASPAPRDGSIAALLDEAEDIVNAAGPRSWPRSRPRRARDRPAAAAEVFRRRRQLRTGLPCPLAAHSGRRRCPARAAAEGRRLDPVRHGSPTPAPHPAAACRPPRGDLALQPHRRARPRRATRARRRRPAQPSTPRPGCRGRRRPRRPGAAARRRGACDGRVDLVDGRHARGRAVVERRGRPTGAAAGRRRRGRAASTSSPSSTTRSARRRRSWSTCPPGWSSSRRRGRRATGRRRRGQLPAPGGAGRRRQRGRRRRPRRLRRRRRPRLPVVELRRRPGRPAPLPATSRSSARGSGRSAARSSRVERRRHARAGTVALGGDYARLRTTAAWSAGAPPATCSPSTSASGDQMLDFRTFQDHVAPRHHVSNLLFKGAVEDQPRAVYTGLIHVGKQAPGAQRLPDQPQPEALRGGLGRVGAQPRDREQRRALQPRLGGRPGRRRAALLPREPGRAAAGGRAARSCSASSTRSSSACRCPVAGTPPSGPRSRPLELDRATSDGRWRHRRAAAPPSTTSPPGEPTRVDVDGQPVRVVRIGDDFYAIGDRCSHADVSLAEGEVDVDDRTIECWKHGSCFSLVDGEPDALPATEPVPGLRRRRSRATTCWSVLPVSDRTRHELVELDGLRAGVGGKEILQGIDLDVAQRRGARRHGPERLGQVDAVRTCSWAGPATRSPAARSPSTASTCWRWPTWERAQAGLFLAMQYPIEVPGVAARGRCSPRRSWPPRRRRRGERPRRAWSPRPSASASTSASCPGRSTSTSPAARRSATRRCSSAVLRPRIAILDEIDSGLDIDALRAVRPPDRGPHQRDGPRRAGHHPLQPPAHRAAARRGARPRRGPHRGRPAGPSWPTSSRPTGYAAYLGAEDGWREDGRTPPPTPAIADPFADPLA